MGGICGKPGVSASADVVLPQQNVGEPGVTKTKGNSPEGLYQDSEAGYIESNGKEIDKMLRVAQDKSKRTHRLVLLGAGECGKTTMVQHMAIVHGKKHTKQEKAILSGLIQATIVEYMSVILNGATEDDKRISDQDEVSDEEFGRRKELIQSGSHPFSTEQLHEKALAFVPLWKSRRIKRAFERRDEYHLPEHADYFFDKLETIMQPNYTPSIDDILRIRVQSTGISEINLDIDGHTLVLVDVGGQRSERKKWLHCFTDVSAVLFVMSLAEFDQVCFEDDSTPRWKESFSVWDSVCRSDHLSRIPFILFMNKYDLFKEKIKRRNLSDFVPAYKGDGSVEDCIRFFVKLYSDRHRSASEEFDFHHDLYVHQTTAIDPENVKNLLNDVRHTVLMNSLGGGGLIAM